MKINIINVAILLVVLVGTLFALSIMPDTVPVHFDIHGVVDRWGSKYEMLIMPGCMLAMLAFWIGISAGNLSQRITPASIGKRSTKDVIISVLKYLFIVSLSLFQ